MITEAIWAFIRTLKSIKNIVVLPVEDLVRLDALENELGEQKQAFESDRGASEEELAAVAVLVQQAAWDIDEQNLVAAEVSVKNALAKFEEVHESVGNRKEAVAESRSRVEELAREAIEGADESERMQAEEVVATALEAIEECHKNPTPGAVEDADAHAGKASSAFEQIKTAIAVRWKEIKAEVERLCRRQVWLDQNRYDGAAELFKLRRKTTEACRTPSADGEVAVQTFREAVEAGELECARQWSDQKWLVDQMTTAQRQQQAEFGKKLLEAYTSQKFELTALPIGGVRLWYKNLLGLLSQPESYELDTSDGAKHAWQRHAPEGIWNAGAVLTAYAGDVVAVFGSEEQFQQALEATPTDRRKWYETESGRYDAQVGDYHYQGQLLGETMSLFSFYPTGRSYDIPKAAIRMAIKEAVNFKDFCRRLNR